MTGFSFKEDYQKYLSYISIEKCSVCNNERACIPMRIPIYLTEVLICHKCLYNVYNFLVILGEFKAQINHDIKCGSVRERFSPKSSLSYLGVRPPFNSDSKNNQDVEEQLREYIPLDEIELTYDEDDFEEFPNFEDDVWAINLKLFSQDQSIFRNPMDIAAPEFVEEIIASKANNENGYYQWGNIIAANDPISKRELFVDYFGKEKPERLYRFRILFLLNFHNWIDPSESFPKMLIRLKDQYDALSLIADWSAKGKIKIFNIEVTPAYIFFLVTPDILHEAFAHPGMCHQILDSDLATLSQDHYNEENEEFFKRYITLK
jgi:hypothetical protein